MQFLFCYNVASFRRAFDDLPILFVFFSITRITASLSQSWFAGPLSLFVSSAHFCSSLLGLAACFFSAFLFLSLCFQSVARPTGNRDLILFPRLSIGEFPGQPSRCSSRNHTASLSICSTMWRFVRQSSFLSLKGIPVRFSCHLFRSSSNANCNPVLNSKLLTGSPCFVPLLSVMTVPCCWLYSLFKNSTYEGPIP